MPHLLLAPPLALGQEVKEDAHQVQATACRGIGAQPLVLSTMWHPPRPCPSCDPENFKKELQSEKGPSSTPHPPHPTQTPGLCAHLG